MSKKKGKTDDFAKVILSFYEDFRPLYMATFKLVIFDRWLPERWTPGRWYVPIILKALRSVPPLPGFSDSEKKALRLEEIAKDPFKVLCFEFYLAATFDKMKEIPEDEGQVVFFTVSSLYTKRRQFGDRTPLEYLDLSHKAGPVMDSLRRSMLINAAHADAGFLRAALNNDDVERFKRFFSPKADGSSLLPDAIRDSRPACAKFLIDHGARVDAVDTRNESCFEICCHTGDVGMLRLLLDSGAAASVTALIDHDLILDNPDFVAMLLDAGCNPNATRSRDLATPLHLTQTLQTARLLIQHGGQIDVNDIQGNTAVYYHAKACDEPMVLLLIQNGADVHRQNQLGEDLFDILSENHLSNAIQQLVDTNQVAAERAFDYFVAQ
jgi:ankyrin repeat protein